jgi:hypothetical protein
LIANPADEGGEPDEDPYAVQCCRLRLIPDNGEEVDWTAAHL